MFSIIVACCKSWAIGKEGKIIHRIKEDLEFFKNKTLGHTVIVGRKTYESIPNRLPGRKIIVISSNKNYQCEVRKDIVVVADFAKAIEFTRGEEEVFIIGGTSVYEQGMKVADKIYLTLVDDYCDGDSYFKNFSEEDWGLQSSECFITSKNLSYQRLIYCRKNIF